LRAPPSRMNGCRVAVFCSTFRFFQPHHEQAKIILRTNQMSFVTVTKMRPPSFFERNSMTNECDESYLVYS
jgi:hypothetical protein